VRSSLFLPFSDLGLIIVDEEHDGSYKQHDPAPRYHARDSAIMLASMHAAKTLLGSASPSVESYNNAVNGKYGLTELKERFGLIKLPAIVLANTREAYRKKLMVSHFTPELLLAMDEALGKAEQIILFQNRRGFSPYIECSECGWIPVCIQCAVNLTYHKGIGKLVCHYCGYTTGMPVKCDHCHSTAMVTRGFGTEKIEDEIKIVFPAARVARMDQDTTRNKNSFNKLIRAFEERRIDILIGTQMISKGLDFENLTVVGILNADNLLNYPDFRAHERSFQLMEQVSGRAGRRQKQGKVVIQTSDPSNRIIRLVLRHDFVGMFRMQTEERIAFNYPPFCRMVKLSIKHKDRIQLNYFSEILGRELKEIFGKRVLGPESPVISRVQLWYIKTILIKIEREKPPAKAKQLITETIERLEKEKGASSLRIAVDVDPY
jgi:primosomal protein N' (replication factor Y)